jgi:glutathione S-transferase
MSRILLHQYDISPFSEKVRVILGIKGLAWSAVEEPVIMPKPELTALTGGYRKIPVMQIGADVYCDTQIIIRELERRHPVPSIHVGCEQGLAWGISMWTDRVLFQTVLPIIFGAIGGGLDPAFVADREKLSGRSFDTQAMRAAAPLMADQLRAQLDWVERQLGDGRAYLFGEAPGLADAAVYYNFAFLRWTNPKALSELLAVLPRVAAWEERVRGIGHGVRSDMKNTEALAVARAATPTTAEAHDPHEPNGLRPGDAVTVMADDYGRDPIRGTLVSSSAQHVAIRRAHDAVGEVVVHFPRAGFVVVRS